MGEPAHRRAVGALLLLVPAPSLGTLAGMWLWPGPVGQTVYALCKAWLLVLPLFWLLRVEKGELSWSPPRPGGLLAGLALGLLIGGAILAAYVLVGEQWIDAERVRQAAGQNGIGSRVLYLAFAAYLILVNSLLEEYVWRWFVFRQTERLLPGWAAVFVSAFFFTIHHVIALRAQFGWGVTLLGAAGVFVGGAVWSWCYQRYRSIWPAYVSHAIVDVAVLLIGWRLIFG
jgi:membrane protease YdiL (CAAX protease family)